MPTSHYAFRLLPFPEQCTAVYAEGLFLINRYEEEDAVNLYWTPGRYFVEVYFDQLRNEVYRCQAFTRGPALDDYLLYVDLPPLD